MSNKVDSNVSGLSFAEESALKTLTGGGTWYGLEPNSFANFGGDLKTTARAPIQASRSRRKGVVTDLDASGGFNVDFTKSNLTRLLQGFFFADAREQPGTKPLNGAQVALTSVASADKSFNAAAGLAIVAVGDLLFASGFTNAANNGMKTVATVAAGKITVAEALVDEAAPPAASMLQRVGHSFAAGDVNVAVTSGIPSLQSTVFDFTTLSALIPGNWIHVGGDLAASRFANNVGFARIASVAAHAVTFDDTTWVPAVESGAGKSLQVFFGTVIRNEIAPNLQKRRSYQLERTLGQGANGTQGEYLVGSIPNELTVNVPKSDKLSMDLSFVACDHTQVTGDPGDTLKSIAGTVVAAAGEDAFNASSHIYRIKLAVADPTTSAPSPLFGYVEDAKLTVKNGVKPSKAVGVLGAFDSSAGNFEVSGSLTAFFSTVAAIKAVRNNADVGLSAIGGAKNAGFCFDIPLIALSGARAEVKKDEPIMIPLTPDGAQSVYGHTMQYIAYPYLPNIGMPT